MSQEKKMATVRNQINKYCVICMHFNNFHLYAKSMFVQHGHKAQCCPLELSTLWPLTEWAIGSWKSYMDAYGLHMDFSWWHDGCWCCYKLTISVHGTLSAPKVLVQWVLKGLSCMQSSKLAQVEPLYHLAHFDSTTFSNTCLLGPWHFFFRRLSTPFIPRLENHRVFFF